MTAFRAAFADMKLVKTRGVTQLIFEIPTEEFDAAYEILGGVPLAGKERWFGIAAINLGKEAMPDNPQHSTPTAARPQPSQPQAGAKEAMDWKDMQPAAQAGIRCANPTFRAFLREVRNCEVQDKLQAEIAVRDLCGVTSRTEFGTDPAKRVIWHQLDTEYQAWLARERVGA